MFALRRSIPLLSLALCLMAAPLARAEEEAAGGADPEAEAAREASEKSGRTIVVTATRIETPIEQVGSSVTVITGEELRRNQYRLVIDALQSVPGVSVRRDSVRPGARAAIFTRGTDSDQTLILLDGIKLNDPSAPNREPLLDNLTVDDVERIEVLRGPQSTLYGSEAIGGVIHIITKKGRGKPSFSLAAEGGSYSTHNEYASASGAVGIFNYAISASHHDTDGFSARSGDGEDDGYRNITVASRFGLEPTDYFDLDVSFRYIDSDLDIDAGSDFSTSDTDTQQFLFRAEPRLELFGGLWEQKLAYWLNDIERHNGGTGFTLPSKFDGRTYGFDWQHNLTLHETNTLVLGYEYESERAHFEAPVGSPDTTFRTHRNSVYLEDQLSFLDQFYFTAGGRVVDDNNFGTETTYRATGAWDIQRTGTILRSSVGTAFKAPSLAQLFDSSFGSQNPDLDPEKSFGVDAGFEQRLWSDRVRFSATFFYNRIRDMIVPVFDPLPGTFPNVNVEKVRTLGAEVVLVVRPIPSLSVTGSYTYTSTKALEAASFGVPKGASLLRRPRNEFSLDASWRFFDDRGGLTARLLYVGDRFDIDPVTFARTKADEYTVVDLLGSFDVTEHVQIFGRVENLFDEDYQDVLGFKSPGVTGFGGVKVQF